MSTSPRHIFCRSLSCLSHPYSRSHAHTHSLHEKLLAHDAQTENYLEDFYREIYTGYEGSNHSLNPTFVMFPKEGLDTAPKSAASLVAASLQHYVHVRDGGE